MSFLSLLVGLLILAPQDPGPTPVAVASLDVSAPEGVVKGTFHVRFLKPVRIYYPERFGLSPTANRWLFVEFQSEIGVFILRPSGAVPKWSHEDGVWTFEPREQIRVSL